ncbi:potassium channel family protein [Dethiothermospora halolimnae]|uniref:potassium channel family protein n=1 Tax=Dethiothermospora halolimnae TaxID=3114390 RepID=UPI003CCB75F0
MITVLLHSIKALHISLERNNIYKLLIIGFLSLIICSSAFYYFESTANPELTFSNALWWGFVTITTVGYGDYYPVTPAGQIIAVILMVLGISAFGFITAAVASAFVENKLKEGMGLMDIKFEDHIVIIGWNNKSEIILKELIEDNPDSKIVIIDKREKLILDEKNVFFVHGDPTKDETLRKANIEKAHTVIVVADENLEDDRTADARSVLICLAVDKLNTNIHLIAEVLNKENISHFERANVDDVIISSEMSSRVMVRSALYKNVSHALKELLTSTYGNEIYETKVSPENVGMPFKNLVYNYVDKYNAVIVGIANNGVFLNPNKDRITEKDDIIIYISKDKL